MTTLELTVPAIKCDGCVEKIREMLVEKIREMLMKRRGGECGEGGPNRKRVTVIFDPEQLRDAESRAAIADAGFAAG